MTHRPEWNRKQTLPGQPTEMTLDLGSGDRRDELFILSFLFVDFLNLFLVGLLVFFRSRDRDPRSSSTAGKDSSQRQECDPYQTIHEKGLSWEIVLDGSFPVVPYDAGRAVRSGAETMKRGLSGTLSHEFAEGGGTPASFLWILSPCSADRFAILSKA